jgi:hypothetical protein
LSAGWVPFQDTTQKQNEILFFWVRGFDFMDDFAHKTVASFLPLFCFCFQDSIPASRTPTKIRSSCQRSLLMGPRRHSYQQQQEGASLSTARRTDNNNNNNSKTIGGPLPMQMTGSQRTIVDGDGTIDHCRHH